MGRFVSDARTKAVLLAKGQRLLEGSRAGAAWWVDEWGVGKAGDRDRPVLGTWVGRREQRDKRLRKDGSCDEVVDALGVAHYSCVNIAGEQALDDACRERLVELQLHVGVGGDVSREDLRQRREHPRSDKADVQPPGLSRTDALGLTEVLLDVAQGPAGPFEKRRPGRRERDRSRCAGQQRASDRVLEPANGLRERRLRHVQPAGRPPEVQLFGDGHEVTQVAELDVHGLGVLMQMNKILDVSVRASHTEAVELVIRPLRNSEDAVAFRALNEEWIRAHFVLEDQDRLQLDDPVAAYIDPGGQILIAELDGRPVGCVALMPDGAGACELSKMAVSPDLRGRGAGRTLLTVAIGYARRMGAQSVFLGSSRKLQDAVHLYEAVGFQHVAPETIHMPYARADVFMRLELPPDAPTHQ